MSVYEDAINPALDIADAACTVTLLSYEEVIRIYIEELKIRQRAITAERPDA